MIKAKFKPSKQKKHKRHSFLGRWQRQIGYAWHNVFNYFYQNIFASLLTIFVIAISITLPTIGYILLKNANQAAEQWYPTPNLTVYIDKTLSDEQSKDLIDKFKAISEVENVIYLSRDETREEFKAWSGFDDALDLLTENPLPAVAIVFPIETAKQTNKLHALQAELQKIVGVDDVHLDDSWFTRLMALTNMVKSIVWTISIFMVIAVSLVIGNSIRLNIVARRQTIIVMQLIGATEGFILRPFLYNGIFTGLISAILALVLSKVFILQIDSTMLQVSNVFGKIVSINGLSWDESLLIILFSIIIGWLSAFIATKKYLNEMVIVS